MEVQEKKENVIVNTTRRELLKKALSLSATMAVANTGVYVVGAAFKELDGSLVAGAKCSLGPCMTTGARKYECNDAAGTCTSSAPACAPLGGVGQIYFCNGSPGTWQPL